MERYLKKLDKKKSKGVNLLEVDIDNIDQGVKLPGVFATNPITGEELPVYVTSYVQGEYGTGAVMGVPFHDERDCAFALANGLKLVQVVRQDEETGEETTLVNSGEQFNGMGVKQGATAIVEELKKL